MHRRELRRWLDDHTPEPGQEASAVSEFRSLLDLPGDIFSRAHFSPGHVTASAVVLSTGGDEIALIDHHKLKKWLQPGGHIEPDDGSLTSAAVREAIEECGPLQLETYGLFDVDVHQLPALGSEPPHMHFDVRILCRVTGGHLALTGEVNAVCWFPFDRPPSPVGTSVARLIAKSIALGWA